MALIDRRALVLSVVTAMAGCADPPVPETPTNPGAAPPPSSGSPNAAKVEASGPSYPKTPERPVVTEYHGVKVSDPYRWLENSDEPEVVKWTEEQSQLARASLEALPETAALRDRIKALMAARSVDYVDLTRRGGTLFALRIDPAKQQPVLVTLASIDDPASAKAIVDPNVIDEKGGVTIDFYVPSRDGKKVAVSLSKGGSESGDLHFYDVATGKELSDVIPHVNGGTAGGSAAWNADGTGVYYTRYPHPGERAPEDMDFYQQVYFHALGTPVDKDRFELGKDLPRIAEIELVTSDDGKYVLAEVANGDGGEFEHYLLGPSKKWAKLTQLSDKVVKMTFGRDGKLYALSRKDAPKGKILRLDPGKAKLDAAETLIPEGDANIQSFAVTKGRLYVADMLGGPSQMRAFDLAKKSITQVPIPPISSVGQIARMDGDEILARVEGFISPPAWYRYDGAGEMKKTKLATTSPADFSDAEVVREECVSKDGTKVPLNIIRKKGIALDGSNPTLLTGYGGFDLSNTPRFVPDRRVWLDQGGVIAVANLRGGGEFGEEWHKKGMLLNKQNVFDDFAACAKHLIDAKYTRPSRLGIIGGSNGGLLMGAMITQHPEMFGAVVSAVGIYDMLRMEFWPNGAFNVPEYGSVKDPEQFKAMYAYSPYHHVKDGVAYPAVLFTTGLNDPRVDPSQSRKMAARLQVASSSSPSKAPILLLARGDAGHGIGGSLSQAIDKATYNYAFLLHYLSAPATHEVTYNYALPR